MATFAFIHGAYHRGAHFARVAEALRAAGHDAVAPDLPATDPAAGAREYAARAAESLRDSAAAPVIVGHSMGGLTAPVLATMVPASRIVYCAALIPEPGRSFDDVSWEDGTVDAPYLAQTAPFAAEDGSASVGPARAREVFFHDAHWREARDAAALLRPQHWKVLQEPSPLESMPGVPSTVIVCRQDRVVNPARLARVARERLGTEPIEIDAGHCPMISRPDALAEALLSLVDPR